MTDEELRCDAASLRRGLGDAVRRWAAGQTAAPSGDSALPQRLSALLERAGRLDVALEEMISVLEGPP